MSDELLQFVPYSSTLDNGFWHQLSKRKLDIYRLDEKPVAIQGFYSNAGVSGLPPLVNLDYSAFDSLEQSAKNTFPIIGELQNTNTLENFKNVNKQELINAVGKEIWNNISSSSALSDPNCLSRLICLTYADLKKYHFIYWFGFPALCYPTNTKMIKKPISINQYLNNEQIAQFLDSYDNLDRKNKSFFLIKIDSKSVECVPLTKYSNSSKLILGFSDPSNLTNHPGWPLRNFLALAAFHWAKDCETWDVLCVRDKLRDGIRSCSGSIVLKITFDTQNDNNDVPSCVGWEKNEKHKMGPRKVDLSASMDPEKLAESAVDLNLKLMKWRLVPDLNLDVISSSKCLLFGAGTLGCNVARGLMGWGVKTISFVDNGFVSFSNPVRQSLFVFEDCLNEGKLKAIAAADALKRIMPCVNSAGYNITIPMPGHAIPILSTDQVCQDVQKIEELIENHDVVFLLTDTRESRWLPTLIAASKQKIVINSALGFDTFMVVRHGVKNNKTSANACDEFGRFPMKDLIPGDHLGCYFCNDVVAPGDSTRDRTLDQQCTVTRPGVSMMAAALAVELLVSLLQHPLSALAPADARSNDALLSDTESILGIVPHQIRGFMSRFYHILPATVAFSNCPACSLHVTDKYESDGFGFLLKVFNEPNFLEEVSGLKQLQDETDLAEVWELSDSDS